jgi:murein DD-endopeptidase MepM/ murein hydrolase activator NlpD
VRLRVVILLVGLSALLLVGGIGAAPSARAGGATSRAYGIQISVPGQDAIGTQPISAPEDTVQFGGTFAYPEDGSIASLSTATMSASAVSGSVATATASIEVTGLKLFNGEITADALDAIASGTATPTNAEGNLSNETVTNLVVLGQAVTATPNQRVELGDWGYLILLEQTAEQATSRLPGYHGFVTDLDVHLTADHGGLPAGTVILVGYVEANVQAASPPPLPKPPAEPTATTSATTQQERQSKARHRAHEPKSSSELPVEPPPSVTPVLTAGGYVFPIYGVSSFVDTFGAPRGDVSGGWHHGDDIFAPLGAPLLACASGTVFSVGWNDVGGNRLWIRDDQGNEFYYAHLSAFSPLARNGARVQAGDVIGFVGNTGDAGGPPFHLHFEVHPVALLGLGYDGAVDPTSYLQAWERLQDIPITAAGAWAPAPSPDAQAPLPGAILLQVSDISSASGLDPASLRRAVAPIPTRGEGAALLVRAALAPPG